MALIGFQSVFFSCMLQFWQDSSLVVQLNSSIAQILITLMPIRMFHQNMNYCLPTNLFCGLIGYQSPQREERKRIYILDNICFDEAIYVHACDREQIIWQDYIYVMLSFELSCPRMLSFLLINCTNTFIPIRMFYQNMNCCFRSLLARLVSSRHLKYEIKWVKKKFDKTIFVCITAHQAWSFMMKRFFFFEKTPYIYIYIWYYHPLYLALGWCHRYMLRLCIWPYVYLRLRYIEEF